MSRKRSPYNPLTMLSRILHGRVISAEFFGRYWLLIVVAMSVLLMYISNKYTCQRAMEQIMELEKQVEVARTEAIRTRSAYMSKLTEQSMQARLDSLHLGLTVQDQPPFTLDIKK